MPIDGGYLTDRGYVRYDLCKSNTLSYLNGNLDALSGKYYSRGFELLTCFKSTFSTRSFESNIYLHL